MTARNITIAFLGFVMGLAAEYLIVAFIKADWGWMSQMFITWDGPDRGIFLYATAIVSGGFAVGSIGIFNSRGQS